MSTVTWITDKELEGEIKTKTKTKTKKKQKTKETNFVAKAT